MAKQQITTAQINPASPAWTSWTPTVTAESGTFTTASASGKYIQIGKMVFYKATITITTVGTAAGGVRITLPVTASTSSQYTGGGRENQATGVQLQSAFFTAGIIATWKYDGTTVAASGRTLEINGFYEAA